MRKTSFDRNHEQFEESLRWYRQLMVKILTEGSFEHREVVELVQALLLRLVSLWETLVVDDLIDALARDLSKYAQELGLRLRKDLSRDESEAVLVGHRYLDFKSVNDARQFAKKHIAEAHNPFRAIPKDCSKLITQLQTMRNYVAHRSSFARRAYERMVRNQYGLSSAPEPAQFLLAQDERTRNARLADYVNALEKASQEMRKTGG